MKIVSIPDLHGKDVWMKIVEKEANSTDKFVFSGDYFDSFDIPFLDQMHNFNNLINFKKENPNKVVLLFGNHDFHYIGSIGEQYSGYQQLKSIDIREAIHNALDENLIQMCYVFNNFLFCHAGLSRTWVSQNLEEHIINDDIETAVNSLFKQNPAAFKWVRDTFKYTDPYGDNIFQGPLWIRPRSLKKDMIAGYTQIVGHTRQDNIILNDNVIFTDILDTKTQYLKIEDTKVSIGEII